LEVITYTSSTFEDLPASACTVLATGLQPILIPYVNLKNDNVLETELELEIPQNLRAGTQRWDPNLSIL
jgi:hypothetical protein